MKKTLLTILLCLIPSIGFSAVEDFTTWSNNVDGAGTGTLTVEATLISTSSDYSAEDQQDYVCNDLGVGNIDAFKYDLDFTVDSMGAFATISIFNVSNEVGVDWSNKNPAINVFVNYDNSNYQLAVRNNSNAEQSILNIGKTANLPITRYITVERYSDVISLKSYTDADRETVPQQVNINVDTDTFRYLCALGTEDQGRSRLVDINIRNYESLATPTETPAGPVVIPIDHPYPADWDFKGGYTGIKSQKRKFFEETPDFIDDFIIYDTNANFPTMAVEGYDVAWQAISPDANVAFTFVIWANTADTIFGLFPDRLQFRVMGDPADRALLTAHKANGNMELDSGWSNYNTPTVNERTSTTTMPIDEGYVRHFSGDTNDGIELTGTIAIDKVADDGVTVITGWDFDWKAAGHVFVVDGTVNIQIIDGDGSTSILNEQIGTAGGVGHWESFLSSDFTTTHEGSLGSGKVRFYCTSVTCEAYVDNITIGEVHRDSGLNTPVSWTNYGNKFEHYRIWHDWEPQYFAKKKRWYLINSLGNVYFIKGANNVDYNQIKGRSGDGYGQPCSSYKARIGSALGCTAVGQYKLEDIKSLGLSDVGFGVSYEVREAVKNPLGNMPNIGNVDMKQGSGFLNEDGTAGFFDLIDGNNLSWVDVYDPDYQRQVPQMIGSEQCNTNGCLVSFYNNDVFFNSPTTDFNNYYYGANRALADVNLMGYILGNEPLGSAGGHCNPMARLMETGTLSSDSTDEPYNETYLAQINWLRTHYGDLDTEGTFLSNIGYDGDYELSVSGTLGSFTIWSDVPGYDSTDTDTDGTPDKDEAAITALNAAWSGTSGTIAIPTERVDGKNAWWGLIGETYLDHMVSGDLNGVCLYDNTNPDPDFREDIHDMLANYQHRFHRVLYDEFFGPDGLFHEKILNYGFGHGYHDGWFRGVRVRADGKKVMRAMAGLSFGNVQDGPGWLTPYSNNYLSLQSGNTLGDELKDQYDETGGDLGPGQGIPFFASSFWYTSGSADHYSRNGIIDQVFTLTGTNGDFRQGGWDCDGLTVGVNCSETTEDFRIPSQTSIGWNCTDNTDLETCADTGVIVYQYIKIVDQPEVRNEFGQYIWFYTDAGSIGNMADNDIITDGTNMLALTSAGTRHSAIVDWEMEAYPGFKSAWVLANGANTTVVSNYSCFRGENGHIQDSDPTDGINDCNYVMLRENGTSPYSVQGWKRLSNTTGFIQDAGSGSAGRADFLKFNVGDSYGYAHLPLDNLNLDYSYIMDTQNKRGKGMVEALKQGMDFKTNNGDRVALGFSLWAIFADYGYSDYTQREVRGFGAWDAKANKKDGIENDLCGWDRICGNGNDPAEAFGDFTTPFTRYIKSIYVIHD